MVINFIEPLPVKRKFSHNKNVGSFSDWSQFCGIQWSAEDELRFTSQVEHR